MKPPAKRPRIVKWVVEVERGGRVDKFVYRDALLALLAARAFKRAGYRVRLAEVAFAPAGAAQKLERGVEGVEAAEA